MQAIAETVFDAFYLSAVTVMGVLLIGIMALVLGFGDAFHLVSRVYALWTSGIDANAAALGFGKLITSITMTFFYLMLYTVWKRRYQPGNTRGLDVLLYTLGAARIALSLLPQNQWLSASAPVAWGVYRNIPFLLMGLVIIVLFFQKAWSNRADAFRYMWLAIALSFAFYAPVVLFASSYPLIGTLMIPKTLAYLWVVWMGFAEQRAS